MLHTEQGAERYESRPWVMEIQNNFSQIISAKVCLAFFLIPWPTFDHLLVFNASYLQIPNPLGLILPAC